MTDLADVESADDGLSGADWRRIPAKSSVPSQFEVFIRLGFLRLPKNIFLKLIFMN